MLIMQLEF